MSCGCYCSLTLTQVAWVGLQYASVGFPGHTDLLFDVSKTCFKQLLKRRQKPCFFKMDNCLMQVKSIAE